MGEIGLLFHRLYIIAASPVVWTLATAVLIVIAPFRAAEMLWSDGIKKHWNDQ